MHLHACAFIFRQICPPRLCVVWVMFFTVTNFAFPLPPYGLTRFSGAGSFRFFSLPTTTCKTTTPPSSPSVLPYYHPFTTTITVYFYSPYYRIVPLNYRHQSSPYWCPLTPTNSSATTTCYIVSITINIIVGTSLSPPICYYNDRRFLFTVLPYRCHTYHRHQQLPYWWCYQQHNNITT